jgi:hypothetical protein
MIILTISLPVVTYDLDVRSWKREPYCSNSLKPSMWVEASSSTLDLPKLDPAREARFEALMAAPPSA